MTTFQRVVKYLAMLLAIALVFLIFAGVGSAIVGVSQIFGSSGSLSEITDDEGYTTETFKQDDIENLKIELAAATLKITDGDTFSVTYSKQGVRVQNKKHTLKIEEKGVGIIGKEKNTAIVLTLPADMNIDKVSVESGAGAVTIEKLVCDKLEFDFGAGEINLGDITVSSKTEIDCGVGRLIISNGKLKNLDFSSGVGECDITARLSGQSKIEAGVGKIRLNLLGEKQDYCISAETGIGVISVDGKRLSDGSSAGEGNNTVHIEGGVGAVKVTIG